MLASLLRAVSARWIGGIVAAGAVTATVFVATDRIAYSDFTTYTSDADFDLGVMLGVNHDAPNNDQLQLNENAGILPFMWVANAGEDTVSKWDVTDNGVTQGREVARYKTFFSPNNAFNAHGAWDGSAPSRTAVDADGNVYVVNRMFQGGKPIVFKILATGGIDRNGNGVIDTSTDTNGDGVISASETKNLTDLNGNGVIDNSDLQDERIAWVSYVGDVNGVGRSLCIAPSGELWVGNFNTRNYYQVDPATGAQLAGPYQVGVNPYGCAIDSNGILWSAALGNRIGTLNTNAPASNLTTYVHSGTNYGITTANGLVYVALYSGGLSYAVFDPSTNTFTYPAYSKGATVGARDNIISVGVLASGEVYGTRHNAGLYKFQPDGTRIWYTPSGIGSTDSRGAIIDSNGNVWSNHVGANRIQKFDGNTGAFLGHFPTGRHPYTYSDATGQVAASSTTPVGYWTVVKDSGVPAADWTSVSWNGDTPTDSSITVSVRAADVEADLDFQTYVPVTNGGDPVPNGRYIQVQVKLTAASDETSPVLYDLTVEAKTNEPPTIGVDADDVTVNEGGTATNGGPVSDPDGDALTLTASIGSVVDNGDGTWSWSFGTTDGPAESQTVTITAEDPDGETDSVSFELTVLNVAPDVDLSADVVTVYMGDTVNLSAVFTDPAASADDSYSYDWDLDGDGVFGDSTGSAAYGDTLGETASFSARGTYILQVSVTDKDGGTGTDSVTVDVANRLPDCSEVGPTVGEIWPPNHQMVSIDVTGVTDADGDAITITIDSIWQDEPVFGQGDGNFGPDGAGVGTSTAEVRAERSGTPKQPGNGRVYHIGYTADDGYGGSCSGTVTVGVPHDQGKKGKPAVDEGPLYDSTLP